MKRKAALLILALLVTSILANTGAMAINRPDRIWMEPESPKEGDTVRFYCEDANATSVDFTVCSEDTGLCYVISDTGKDGNVWWAEVRDIPAGEAHYEIRATYYNETTGNESTYLITRVFYVQPPEQESVTFPIITVAGVVASISLILVAYWGWRRMNR